MLRNLGNGTFGAASNYASGPNPTSVAAADLDGDGRSDLVVSSATTNTLNVLLSTCLP